MSMLLIYKEILHFYHARMIAAICAVCSTVGALGVNEVRSAGVDALGLGQSSAGHGEQVHDVYVGCPSRLELCLPCEGAQTAMSPLFGTQVFGKRL